MTNNDYLDENAYESEDLSNISFDMEDNPTLLANATDGYPITSGKYEESDWYTGGSLGIAGDFHMFAFDQLILNQHLNGNFATPNLYLAAGATAIGPNNDIKERMLSVVSNSIGLIGVYLDDYDDGNGGGNKYQSAQIKFSDLYVPSSCTITQFYPGQTNLFDLSPMKQYEAVNDEGNKLVGYGNVINESTSRGFSLKEINGQCYIQHAGSDYIDFSSYKTKYQQMSNSYSKLQSNVEFNNGNINLPDSSVQAQNILNITASDFNSINQHFSISGIDWSDGQYQNNQTLVINVDLAGQTDFAFNKDVKYSYKGSTDLILNGGEDSLYKGTNILWNFYDSSETDGVYKGKIHNTATINGQFLAPGADVKLDVTFNGNAIANKIVINQESHRADYLGAVIKETEISVTAKKKWLDNGSESHSAVMVNLYQSTKPRLSGDDILSNSDLYEENVELNEGNNWQHQWENLPNHDSDGNTYYYYIVETNKPSDYGTAYLNNGVGKSNGTITVKNYKPEYTELTVEKKWFDRNGNSISSPTDEIEFKLYQSTFNASEKPGDAELYPNETDAIHKLNSSNNWSTTIGNLPPVNEKGENLYYYVEETSVENYKATYEKNGNTITIKNKKNDGGLEINKQWVDKDGNPTSPTVNNITVNLKRALTAPSQTTSSGTGSDTREDGLEIVGQVDYPRYNGGVVDITDSTNSKVVKAMTENVRNKVSKIEITVVGSPNGAFQYNCDQSGNNGSSNIQLNTSTIDLDNISLTSNYIKLDMYGDFTASVKFLAPIAPKYTLNIDWNGVASEDDIFIAELYECDTTSDVGTSVANVSLKPDTNSTNFDGYELISNKYYYVKVKDNSVKDGYTVFGLPTSKIKGDASVTSDISCFGSNGAVSGAPSDAEFVAGYQNIVLNAANGWSYRIEELPFVNASNQTYYYYFEEVVPNGAEYIPIQYSGNGVSLSTDSTKTINLTNMITGDTPESTNIQINVEKIWRGFDSKPNSITVQLQRNSDNGNTWTDVSGKSATLDESNQWKCSFIDLPKKSDDDSVTYQYKVVEKNIPVGYNVSYSSDKMTESGTVTITNTLKSLELAVNKKWIDNNSSNRPDITLTLQRKLSDSGTWQDYASVQPTPTKNGSTWTYTYSNLPAYDTNGTTKYYYRVVEKSNPSGYVKVSADSNGVAIDSTDKTITIINIKTLSLNLTKNWSDPDTQHNDITVEIHRSTNPNDVPKQTFITVTSTSMSASATSTTILTTTTAPTTKTYVFNNLPQNNKPTNGGDYIASVSNSFKYKLNSSDSYTNGTISSDGSSTISNVPADNSYIKYQVGAVYKLDLTRIKSGDTVTFKFNSDNKDNTNFGYYSNKSGGFVGFTKSSDNTYSVKITDDISHYEFQCWSNEPEITDTSSLSFTANGMSSLIEVSVTAASAPSGNVVSGTITDYSSSPVIELAQIRKAKFTFSGNEWAEAKIKIKKSTNVLQEIKIGFFNSDNTRVCIELPSDAIKDFLDPSTYIEKKIWDKTNYVFNSNSITFTFNDAVDSIQIEISNSSYKFTSIEYVVSDDSTAQFKSAFKISGLNLLASNQGSNSNTDATLVQEVTLGSNNSWTKTISDLPMYDESGNVYYYWVEEKFVNEYQSSYQYGDSPGDTGYITGNNGNITILNTKVTSGSIEMPSTGGKGINDYRNAGIIMMTASAGIYIALKILKKKSMEFK
ncbi:MAG: Cna B-type domain-containing protein [Ruminococcus sp.]|nr:Cna B-type domain-containing protein [Ruminococcus sp.]